jgi:hypothetical protein
VHLRKHVPVRQKGVMSEHESMVTLGLCVCETSTATLTVVFCGIRDMVRVVLTLSRQAILRVWEAYRRAGMGIS